MAAILKNKMDDMSYLKTLVKFGFLGCENIGIDTKIKFLSLLLAEIWDIDNSLVGHFSKWPPQPSKEKSEMAL